MTDKTMVTVRILDKEYQLRAGEDPEHIRRVAYYLDRRLQEIKKAAPNIPARDVAVLGALNIVDEYMTEGRVEMSGTELSDQALEEIHNRVRRLIDLIPG